MKAVYIERHGGPDVLRYGDMPDPAPQPGEVVVDVAAASVNGADWKVRNGKPNPLPRFPHILGRDFSGTVTALGEGVGDFRVGEEVFGVCETSREGAYAQKVAIAANIVARKPPSLSHVDAAALGLTGLTALSAIEDTIALKAGETILVQGGAGGVAGFAIQLAKHIGARVITTASAGNHDYLRALGADELIDYNRVDFTAAIAGCDAVFETVGGDVATKSFQVLKPGGRAAFIASGPQPPAPPRDDVRALRPPVRRNRPHLERIVHLYETGAVKRPEVTLYRLQDAAAAHKVSEGRHLRGKLVFEVG